MIKIIVSLDWNNLKITINNVNPFHPNISMHILHTVLYTFPCKSTVTYRENLFNNQKVFELVIISFFLMTVTHDSGVILYVEIRCWTLLTLNSQDLIVNSPILLLHNSLSISCENLMKDQDDNFYLISLSILINHLLKIMWIL